MKKKLSVLAFIIALMCFLSSCVTISDDPIKLAMTLDEKGYEVTVSVDSEDITELGDDEFDANFKDVYCIVVAFPNDGDDDEKGGVVLYCESRSAAKKLEKAMKDYIDENDYLIRGTVERTGKIVFVGCEDMLEDMR